MNISKTYCSMLSKVDGELVRDGECEVIACVSSGGASAFDSFCDVGSFSNKVVRCAIEASGYRFPRGAVDVQVVPISGDGKYAELDLAVAVAILAASGQIDEPHDGIVLNGRLKLNGECYSTARDKQVFETLRDAVNL